MSDFPSKWIFLRSVPSLKFLPISGPPEIAFCGRSNVGKSSLINAITNNGLARTSNTPGRTQELNFFIPDKDLTPGDLPKLAIIDMPGYGYAQAPKKLIESWTSLIKDYLRGRTTLKRVYILIDSRIGIKSNDVAILKMLDTAAVSYQVILTKADKVTGKVLDELKQKTLAQLTKHPAAYPEIITTSSAKRIGIQEIKDAIMLAIRN